MNEYQLIEFTSMKKINKIISNNETLYEVLTDFYKEKIHLMFDSEGLNKGFFSVFLNSKQLLSINNIHLKNKDEISMIFSISGG